MNIPAQMATQIALTRQAIGMEVMKQQADQSKAVVDIITQAAESVPAASGRGATVNIAA